jgi:hypothetical protein
MIIFKQLLFILLCASSINVLCIDVINQIGSGIAVVASGQHMIREYKQSVQKLEQAQSNQIPYMIPENSNDTKYAALVKQVRSKIACALQSRQFVLWTGITAASACIFMYNLLPNSPKMTGATISGNTTNFGGYHSPRYN